VLQSLWCEVKIKHRIKAAWQKWKDLSGVFCDTNMLAWIKGKVYKAYNDPASDDLLSKAWTAEERRRASKNNRNENAKY